jgi:hypothetical protein
MHARTHARTTLDVSLRYTGTAGHCCSHKIKKKLTVNKYRESHAFLTYKILVNKISYSHNASYEILPHYTINSWLFWSLCQVFVFITPAMTVWL